VGCGGWGGVCKASYESCVYAMKWVHTFGWKDVQDIGGDLDGEVLEEWTADGQWNVIGIEGRDEL
jgi:hypothetical protein